jgi:hypothetical protein
MGADWGACMLCPFPLESSASPRKVRSAAWTEPVPVDPSSLCNIDHFPNFRTQDDLAGAFGSGAELALHCAAIEITDEIAGRQGKQEPIARPI